MVQVNINMEKLERFDQLRRMSINPEKLERLGLVLEKSLLCLPDNLRDKQDVGNVLQYLFPQHSPQVNLIYEIKAFDGLLGFLDIQYGHTCDVVFHLWNRKAFNHKLLRGLKQAHREVAKQFALKRLAFSTPNIQHVQIYGRLGFLVEGRQAKAFLWNGKLFTNHLMRVIREV